MEQEIVRVKNFIFVPEEILIIPKDGEYIGNSYWTTDSEGRLCFYLPLWYKPYRTLSDYLKPQCNKDENVVKAIMKRMPYKEFTYKQVEHVYLNNAYEPVRNFLIGETNEIK